ncbi:hypothetical protein [Anoxybacillus gonensis]|uniref:hypothetical protein n=1 Tax=Anoxybacillus gonensis TaxID=198467 RepID=UPI0002BFD905|nr:hypothetical protein [Anoxybacillus gonensis]EMI11393.1 hypothetical protein F510_0570 [Anoxybacillus gonensis]
MSEIESLIAWAERASDSCLLLFVFIALIALIDSLINSFFREFSETKIYKYIKYGIGILILLSIFGLVIYSFVII